MTTPTEGADGQPASEESKPVLSDVPIAEVPQPNARPDNVPEKFWDASKGAVNTEALLKSYTELEKARAPQEQAPAPAAEAEAKPSSDGRVKVEEKQAQDANAALFDGARTEWAEKQELSAETYENLQKAGYPRQMVDMYLAGVRAETEKTLSTLYGYVGDQATFDAMTQWAGTAMSKEEAEAYNSALDNPALRENAVRGLYARYQAANAAAPKPSEGNLVTPSGANAMSGETYTSRDQLIADQKDPRYQTDSAFRANVAAKLERSRQAGSMGPVVERSMFPRSILSN